MRKSLNLTERDEAVLGPFLVEGSDEREELADVAGDGDVTSSDSAALIALARLGAGIVRARLLERGYAEWGAAWSKDDAAFVGEGR